MDALAFLKLVLDPDRLAVLGTLAARSGSADEIATTAGVEPRIVLATIAPLLESGHVHAGQVDGVERYELVRHRMRELARDLPSAAPPAPSLFMGMRRDEQDVLARFFSGRQLLEIPAQRSKRLVVLERLALEFEPGRRYREPEVNKALGAFHPDHASLRRYLVDEGFMDRAAGEYWRSGGRVPDRFDAPG